MEEMIVLRNRVHSAKTNLQKIRAHVQVELDKLADRVRLAKGDGFWPAVRTAAFEERFLRRQSGQAEHALCNALHAVRQAKRAWQSARHACAR